MGRSNGFSLREMILVGGSSGLRAALVLPKMLPGAERSKIKTTQAQISGLETALGQFGLDQSEYPSTAQGLRALVEKPADLKFPDKWMEYLPAVPQDAWGYDYFYTRISKDKYELYSVGPAGQKGTDDDVHRIQKK